MASVLTPIRLANPGRRKRVVSRRKNAGKKRMTLKQKLFFGTKAQRSAAQRNLGHKRRTVKRTANSKVRRRRKNVGQILLASNPGRRKRRTRKNVAAGYYDSFSGVFHPLRASYDYDPKRVGEGKTKRKKTTKKKSKSKSKGRVKNPSMARRRRKAAASRKTRRVYRRRRNPVMKHVRRHRRRRTSNPKVVVRYRNRGRKRMSHRRRNPSISSVGMELKSTFALLGGAYVTNKIMQYVPAMFSQGIIGYVVTGVVAYLQGRLLGKIFKSPGLANDITKGGFVYLGLKMAGDFGLGGNLPIGLQGLGLITPSSFYTPQVPVRGSMGSFLLPPAVGAALPVVSSGMHGLTRNAIGGGRMGQRRVGRMS